ncbi:MAG: ROK family protein [Hyphomicrobiaceae bacterium]|nr:ROK family protein [Hyphomicrobiaceae bacterium]
MPLTPPPALLPDTPTIGIDLGGTKIEAIALDGDGRTLARIRVPTPRDDYDGTIAELSRLAGAIEQQAAVSYPAHVGLAMPGSLAPSTGLVQNANSTWLNGRPFGEDLTAALARPLRIANDANCFALSEAEDGTGLGAHLLFGVILGTGCGGGIVHAGRLIDGPRGIGGEWGHNPLPWPSDDEHPGPTCWCGRRGCLEAWISGPGLAADHARVTGEACCAEDIVAAAMSREIAAPNAGNSSATAARASLDRHASRLARGLAHVVNLIDPDVIVLGGGLSNLAHLYAEVPRLMQPYIFADDRTVSIRPPAHGDASGARGAARLWRQPTRE